MDDLVTWLRAQLDDDERVADSAMQGPWSLHWIPAGRAWQINGTTGTHSVARIPNSGQNEDTVKHITRHDPARVLRQVERDRRLIQRYELVAAASTALVSFTRGQDDGYRQACLDAIRDAAEVYADRPGYRDEWKP